MLVVTWKRRMSLGFPAFFKQFWLHFRKNFRKNLKWQRITKHITSWLVQHHCTGRHQPVNYSACKRVSAGWKQQTSSLCLSKLANCQTAWISSFLTIKNTQPWKQYRIIAFIYYTFSRIVNFFLSLIKAYFAYFPLCVYNRSYKFSLVLHVLIFTVN